MRRRSTAAQCAALVALLLAADASASGYFLPFRGVRPMGRGGAVTASGGGAHALWFNPAALVHMGPGTHVMLEGSLVSLDSTFSRTPRTEANGDVTVYDPVSNEKPPDVIPSLALTSDFGVDGLMLGLGVLGPYASRYRYPVEGAQRYAAIDTSEALNFVIGLGGAYRITDWLAVGATVQNIWFDTKLYVMGSAYTGLFGAPEDPDLDILMAVHSTDRFTLSGNAGVWAQIVPGLEVALSVQLGAPIRDGDAALEVRLPTHPFFDGARVEGDSVSGSLDLPMSVRGALRWVHGRGDVEVNVVWEGWSVHDAIRTTPADIRITGVFGVDELVVGPLTVPMAWEDTVAINAGSDFEVLPGRLTLRAGLSWEPSAIPEERLSVFQLDLDKVIPTLGLTVAVPEANLLVDVGYAHVFFADRAVTNSQVEQINPTFEEGAIVTGNGFYEASVDIVGVGVEVVF